VRDANGQQLAYVYYSNEPERRFGNSVAVQKRKYPAYVALW
jgi:hypothetical protein